MSFALPGPCPDGHQELKLMTEVTTLADHPDRAMMCNACNHVLTFEDAVRNDERMKLDLSHALLLQEVTWYREKVIATAQGLDQLASTSRAKGRGFSQATWAFENAARLVRRIDEGPVASQSAEES